MKFVRVFLLIELILVLGVFSVFAESTSRPDKNSWQRPILSGELDSARKLCEEFLEIDDNSYKAEGHKCLYNLELIAARKPDLVTTVADDFGEIDIRQGYTPEHIEKALSHLNSGIYLAPDDISIHQARIHVLMITGRYQETSAALEDSIKKYKQSNAIEVWLNYSQRFYNDRQIKAGIEFLKLIESNYPVDHRVIANLGAFYSLINQNELALKYSLKSLELNPEDPKNNWNIARLYDNLNQVDKANEYYTKVLEMKNKNKDFPYYAYYSDFVENKLKDKVKACEYRAKYCPDEYQEKCK